MHHLAGREMVHFTQVQCTLAAKPHYWLDEN